MKIKQIIKPLLGCFITLSLTLSMLLFAGDIMTPSNSLWCTNVIKAFHSLDENSLEVIVYGSSHAWRGCDTRVMCDEYGMRAYNYGCNWQAINTTSLFFQDSLRTQKPKVVCIEVGMVDRIEEDVDLDGQIYYTRVMPDFEAKREYLQQCFGNNPERYLSYYLPIIMFHDNWNQISSAGFNNGSPEIFLESYGYCSMTAITELDVPDYANFSQRDIPESCLESLDQIVEICNEEGISIIFFTCPSSYDYFYGDAMQEYADENNCVYIDFFDLSEEIGIDWSTDFSDAGHLNDSGSSKIATYLSEYIIANYDVENSVN